MRKTFKSVIVALLAMIGVNNATAQSWTADNGNGTYTNPLFYDEFSDPDVIRVGEDYYLASCEEYTQEELAEAGELLESLLTEEQLSHVTGEAGILEGELNELFFGGGSRIVFPCDIGMIFH